VIKVDSHQPIRLEVKGYNQVKELLGKHIPSFKFPVVSGEYSGVAMELASMEGKPMTLQEHLVQADDDSTLQAFILMLNRALKLMSKRLYLNTKRIRRLAPYRHFKLYLDQHTKWLEENLNNVLRYPNEHIFISSEAIVSMFNMIRKNNDAIYSEMCIAHGDLNLANIITDTHKNLWAIDWTHTDLHPMGIDFAKMENDIKFVISKELDLSDSIKLRELEEYLLNHQLPQPLEELPEELGFVSENLKFKKIYEPIRHIRIAYQKLSDGADWLNYRIALLKFALHTLSFDKKMNKGECTPAQLWYALISVEILLFLLVSDDFHLKTRSERPKSYPDRFRILIDAAEWEEEAKEYNPPYHVEKRVLELNRYINPKGKADSEDFWSYPEIIDWGVAYKRDQEDKPLNPHGRKGISGRGSLWFWGSNPMIFLCPITYNQKYKRLECIVHIECSTKMDIACIHVGRDEPYADAMIRAQQKINLDLNAHYSIKLQEGYFYDYRETDNSWIEAQVFLIYIDEPLENHKPTEGYYWKELDHHLINRLHSSYANLFRMSLQHLYDKEILTDPIILDILEKTS
ncbi:MAG: hypothetical protein AAFO07_21625, partial [Bacteroidota bacterium]